MKKKDVMIVTTIQLTLSGRVQGVGMRFFIHRSARQFEINGYVKNCYNGTVEALLQAPQTVLDTFIEYMKKNAPGYIERVVKDIVDTDKTYSKFTIKLF
jgi:acylphosphatase